VGILLKKSSEILVGAKKTLKKAEKQKIASLKKASKTQVRATRTTLRAAKAAEKAGVKKKSDGAKLQATKGQAPQSARITPPKGPIQPVASRTQFGAKEYGSRKWLIIDVAGQTVGRVASEIANLLRGKHKPEFTPNNDVGDFVVVINAEQVKFTANKEEDKMYYHHSGYISGLKEYSPSDLRTRAPERIIYRAVRGMISRSPLGRVQMSKLKIYIGSKHPHAAQKPVVWALRNPTNA
jgi:large subunit ribosomal protein L13